MMKARLLSFVNQHSRIRKMAKLLMRRWWGIRFLVTDFFIKTNDQTVVFKVYQGRQYTCSPRALYEEMLQQERFLDYQFLWIFRDPEDYRWLSQNNRTKVIRFGTQAYYNAFAKSKFWIVNSRTRQSLRPGKTHCYVQTWHGTPLKRLGCDIDIEGNNIVSVREIRADYQNEGRRVTFFLSPSAFYTKKILSAFAIADKKSHSCIIEAGYPRNDSLFKERPGEAAEIRQRLGISDDRKVILYAPTFRDNQHSQAGCSFSLGFDLGQFCRQFGDQYVLLIRSHYFVTQQLDLKRWTGTVFDVSKWLEINELYKISDMLITDYSSVFFDYANLKRPIIFFMYDLEEYRQNIRNFYLDINMLPGNVVQTWQELYREIKRLENCAGYDQRYQQFHNTFNYLDGPDAAAAVLKQLIPEDKKDKK